KFLYSFICFLLIVFLFTVFLVTYFLVAFFLSLSLSLSNSDLTLQIDTSCQSFQLQRCHEILAENAHFSSIKFMVGYVCLYLFLHIYISIYILPIFWGGFIRRECAFQRRQKLLRSLRSCILNLFLVTSTNDWVANLYACHSVLKTAKFLKPH